MDLQKLTIDRGTGPRRARRRRSKLVPAAVVLALGAGLWLAREPLLGSVKEVLGRSAELPAVDVVRAEMVDPAEAVRTTPPASGAAANGYVVARRRAALSADTPGRIIELNVEEGSVVKEGDVVARLFGDETEAAVRRAAAEVESARVGVDVARANVQSARAALAEATAFVSAVESQRDESREARELANLEAERAATLFAKGAIPAEQRDRAASLASQAAARDIAASAAVTRAGASVTSAEATVAVAEARVREAETRVPAFLAALDQARATLDKTYVRAPFDGIVVLKDAEVGEVVSPNALGGQSRGSVATMVDFSTLEVQVELPETSLGSVEVGGPVSVYFDAFANERFPGRVDRIWPTANRQKATIEVRVVLAELDPRLRPEMGVRVVFEREAAPVEEGPAEDRPPVLAVPATALASREGARGVFVLEGSSVRFQALTTGETLGGMVEVVNGLDAGTEVVRRATPELRSGMRVEITGADAPNNR